MKNTMKGFKKGFTLVELLFVMAVISILAGFGISQMSGSTDTAEDIVAKGNVRNAITEAQLYFANNGNYDDFVSDLDVITGTTGIADGNSANSFCLQATGSTKTYFYNSASSSNVTEGDCGFPIPGN